MDRVSNLPDELLCHILSFLPTKHAALTSVLSTRWRNLLAFVPNLDIDDSVFLHPEEGKQKRHEILQSFMDFVDRILALQGDSRMNKVSIKCKYGVDRDRVKRWICNVLQRGVLDLELLNSTENDCWHSSEVFRSRTLVKLKLGNVAGPNIGSGDYFLPLLKTLVLDSFSFSKGQLQMLLSVCPVLEKLDMAEIRYGTDLDMTVSSASLKTLAFHPNYYLRTLSLETPSLVCLAYSGVIADDYPLVNLENLVEAQIKLKLTDYLIELAREPDAENDVSLRLGNMRKLVRGIRNVHKLYLNADTVELLSLCCESMPVFKNLKVLHIKSAEDRRWQAFPVLLRNCPRLETLVIEGLFHEVTGNCGDACDCIAWEDKGRSLISCPVKKLHIKGFRGTVREFKMMEHFMKSFKCLKEMEIYGEEDSPTLFKDPEMFHPLVEMMKSYNMFYTCDVKSLVRGKMAKW